MYQCGWNPQVEKVPCGPRVCEMGFQSVLALKWGKSPQWPRVELRSLQVRVVVAVLVRRNGLVDYCFRCCSIHGQTAAMFLHRLCYCWAGSRNSSTNDTRIYQISLSSRHKCVQAGLWQTELLSRLFPVLSLPAIVVWPRFLWGQI